MRVSLTDETHKGNRSVDLASIRYLIEVYSESLNDLAIHALIGFKSTYAIQVSNARSSSTHGRKKAKGFFHSVKTAIHFFYYAA